MECKCTAPQIEAHICPPHNNSSVYLTTIAEVLLWADHRWNAESWRALRDSVLSSPPHPPGMAKRRTACVQLNRLRTGVRHLLSSLHKWGITSSAACECGTEYQTVDHRCLLSTSPWSTAWRFWMMRYSIVCSTPTPKSSAFRQWTERTGSSDYDEAAFACLL